MTEEMISRFVEEVRRVCVEPGYGEVAVVIEKRPAAAVASNAGAMAGRADRGSAGGAM